MFVDGKVKVNTIERTNLVECLDKAFNLKEEIQDTETVVSVAFNQEGNIVGYQSSSWLEPDKYSGNYENAEFYYNFY